MISAIPARFIARARAIAGATIATALLAASACGLLGVFTITLGFGLSLASSPAQAARPAGCGHLGQRPCNVLEFLPSCEAGLTELGTCRNLAAEAAAAKAAAERAAAEARARLEQEAAAAKAAAEKARADAQALADRQAAATKAAADKARADAQALAERQAAAAKAAAGKATTRPSSCGHANQRPCTVVEFIPSCDAGLKEDFAKNACVALAPGEWSPFLAGLKSFGGAAAVKTCMNTAADYVQANGSSPSTRGLMMPGGAGGIGPSDALKAYVAIGFACSTPHLLQSIALVAEALGKIDGSGPTFQQEMLAGIQKWYDTDGCKKASVPTGGIQGKPGQFSLTWSPDSKLGPGDVDVGRWTCAVAGFLGGEASDGIACVVKGAQAGAFNDFMAGGARSERAFGLATGQVLEIVGEVLAIQKAAKALKGPAKKAVEDAWKKGIDAMAASKLATSGMNTVGAMIGYLYQATQAGLAVNTAERAIGRLGQIPECTTDPITLARAPASAPPQTGSPDSAGTMYAVVPGGDLWRFRYPGWRDASGGIEGPQGLSSSPGNGVANWNGFHRIFSAGDGVLYAVTQNGDLWWFRDDGWRDGKGAMRGPKGISSSPGGGLPNWKSFTQLFAGSDGTFYGVVPGGDLWWFRYPGWRDGTGPILGPKGLSKSPGNGVANWNSFAKLFAGPEGLIYGVVPGGDLWWFRYPGWGDGTGPILGPKGLSSSPGNGVPNWTSFAQLLTGPDGVIYGVVPGGDLWWFRYPGWREGTGSILGPKGLSKSPGNGIANWRVFPILLGASH